MRVLFVGNSNRRFLGNRYYLYDQRIYNGLLRNGHAVHFFCDRSEARSEPVAIKKLARTIARRRLLATARHFRPEALILTHTKYVDREALQALKDLYPDLRMAQLNVDALYSDKNQRGILKRQSVLDANFTTTGGSILSQLSTPQSPFYYLPNITDGSIDTGRAHELVSPTYDLSCFMHDTADKSSDHHKRMALANGVVRALPELRYCYRGFNGNPGIYGHEYIDVLGQSAMALNLTRDHCAGTASTAQTRYLYSSDRLAHITGNGALAFIEKGFALEHLYSEREAIFFHSLDDLIEKCRFYTQHPKARQTIAAEGWKKAHHEFNETVVMQYVLERLFNLPLSRPYAWPTNHVTALEAAA